MMTRKVKALQLSCTIHALLVLTIVGATRNISAPLPIDLQGFTLLEASDQGGAAPVLATARKEGQDTTPVEVPADSKPTIIEQQRKKVAVAPRPKALVVETPQAEPALTERSAQEEATVVDAESAVETVVPKPIPSSPGHPGAAPCSPPVDAGPISEAAPPGAVTGQPSMTSQEQYLAIHFAGIRDRILRNLSYPAVARKRGWTGQVRLSFRINHQGAVEGITVLASSGYDLLDRQAMAVVREVAPFPLPLENAEITMPITFSLSK